MEIAMAIIVIALIRAIASAASNRRPAITTLVSTVRESLCSTCAYPHIARGFREREKLIACTLGGSVRPLKFAVSNCTRYCNRNAIKQTVRIAGFARPAEALGEWIAAKANDQSKTVAEVRTALAAELAVNRSWPYSQATGRQKDGGSCPALAEDRIPSTNRESERLSGECSASSPRLLRTENWRLSWPV